MNKPRYPFAVPGQEDSLALREAAAVHAASLHELIHELRQPLSTIESLAYFIELPTTEDKICAHMQKIRDMLLPHPKDGEPRSSQTTMNRPGVRLGKRCPYPI